MTLQKISRIELELERDGITGTEPDTELDIRKIKKELAALRRRAG